MTAQANCELTEFGPSTDATTSINLKGGLVNAETSKRMRSRSWPGRSRLVKRAPMMHRFRLEEVWARREALLGVP